MKYRIRTRYHQGGVHYIVEEKKLFGWKPVRKKHDPLSYGYVRRNHFTEYFAHASIDEAQKHIHVLLNSLIYGFELTGQNGEISITTSTYRENNKG